MTIEQDREQLFLELVNRARLDPAAEAARYGLSDLSTGTGTLISTDAKQVLAPNEFLHASALGHTNYMLANDVFSHTGAAGSTPGDRMVAAGYDNANSFGYGENIAWTGTTGTLDINAQVYEIHKNLFLSAGHRRNMLNANFEESGVSAAYDANFQGYKALMATFNFGYHPTAEKFITGVAYTDTDNNDFYSIGESNVGLNVRLLTGNTTVDAVVSASGGYGLATVVTGNVEIVWSGGNLLSELGITAVLADQNIKVDLVDGHTIETNVTATLTRASEDLRLLGINNVSGTGNAADNDITGNKGSNTLTGLSGNDTLDGGAGDDRLIGGEGADTLKGGIGLDTAVFEGVFASYQVSYVAATQSFTISDPAGISDTIVGVENFEFSDRTLTAAQLQSGAAVPIMVSVTPVTASVVEGNFGMSALTFQVRLSTPALTTKSVDYQISGGSLNPAGLDDLGSNPEGHLEFAPGETVKLVTIYVTGDWLIEQNETVRMELIRPSSQLGIATAAATATIINDDFAPITTNGTELDNILRGSSKSDIIFGLDGNDRIDGGVGADQLYGGNGNDIYVVNSGSDFVSEFGTNGIDTINASINYALSDNLALSGEVENLTLLGRATLAEGNDFGNTLVGNAGVNILRGFAGEDTLVGGRGADVMRGGADDDTYMVDNIADVVDEIADNGDGVDLVVSSVSFDLRQSARVLGDVEKLLFSGFGALVGIGNELGNTLVGNAGANTLYGQGGEDILDGGLGSDTLFGGVGADVFQFSQLKFGRDVVRDYEDGIDHLSFAQVVADSFEDFAIVGNDTNLVSITINGQKVSVMAEAPIHISADDFIFS